MAQQQAIREEQLFFRLEMLTETALQTTTRRRLFKFYEKLADYGFSLTRPFWFWLLCLGGFGLAHGAIANWSAQGSIVATNIAGSRTLQWAQYVLFNAIPLPGFDKTQLELRSILFTGDALTLVAIMLDMLHKGCALLAVFLAALALRNLFKMKG